MEYIGLSIFSIMFYKKAKEYEKEFEDRNNYDAYVEYEHRDVKIMVEKYYLMSEYKWKEAHICIYNLGRHTLLSV